MSQQNEQYYCVAHRNNLANNDCFAKGTVECHAYITASQQFICPTICNGQITFSTPPSVESEVFYKVLMDRILYGD